LSESFASFLRFRF